MEFTEEETLAQQTTWMSKCLKYGIVHHETGARRGYHPYFFENNKALWAGINYKYFGVPKTLKEAIKECEYHEQEKFLEEI